MNGIDTVRDVYRVAEMLSQTALYAPLVATFKEQYLCELREQFSSPYSDKQELERTIWLDMVRWLVAFRWAYLRHISGGIQGRVLELAPVYASTKYNPYCNYTMSRGWTCEKCPLVVYDIVEWETGVSALCENAFMRCSLRNRRLKMIKEYLTMRDFFKFFQIVKSEVWSGSAVLLWRRLGNRPPWPNGKVLKDKPKWVPPEDGNMSKDIAISDLDKINN